jgi:hypothetical protein
VPRRAITGILNNFCRRLSRRAGVIAASLRRATARAGGHVKRSLELTKAVHSYAQLAMANTAPAAVRPKSARQTDAPFCGVDDGNLATTHIDPLLF